MSVCLLVYFPHEISKNDAATITKRDVGMFGHESGNSFILGSKGQRSRSPGTKNIDGVSRGALVSAGFFCSSVCFARDGFDEKKKFYT